MQTVIWNSNNVRKQPVTFNDTVLLTKHMFSINLGCTIGCPNDNFELNINIVSIISVGENNYKLYFFVNAIINYSEPFLGF